jgi:hypothetical protein
MNRSSSFGRTASWIVALATLIACGGGGGGGGTDPPPQSQGSLSIVLTGDGSGVVTSSPAGLACPGVCTAPFALGATLTLTATPDPGSRALEWGEPAARPPQVNAPSRSPLRSR